MFDDIRIYLIVGFIRHTTGMTHLKTITGSSGFSSVPSGARPDVSIKPCHQFFQIFPVHHSPISAPFSVIQRETPTAPGNKPLQITTNGDQIKIFV